MIPDNGSAFMSNHVAHWSSELGMTLRSRTIYSPCGKYWVKCFFCYFTFPLAQGEYIYRKLVISPPTCKKVIIRTFKIVFCYRILD